MQSHEQVMRRIKADQHSLIKLRPPQDNKAPKNIATQEREGPLSKRAGSACAHGTAVQ